jgi:hypothetical protein
MANDYCSAEEVENVKPDEAWAAESQVLLAALVTRASRAIDTLTRREPGFWYVSADTTRYFDGEGGCHLYIGYLATTPTSVAVAESGDVDGSGGTGGTYTTLAATDYYLYPYNALAEGRPFTRLDRADYDAWPTYERSVKVVGKFGWALAVPPEVKQAAIIQTTRWYKRGYQMFHDTGGIIELGQLRYTQQLDPDIAALLPELVEAHL